MTPEDKIAVFEEELDLIPSNIIQQWTADCLRLVPDYFFEIGAADSMKYHPYWDLGPGGTVRHTKAVVYVATLLSGTAIANHKINKLAHDTDLSKILSACILHDSCKYGINFDYRVYDLHPYLPRVLFQEVSIKPQFETMKDWIFKAIESHMGSRYDGSWSALPHVTRSTFAQDNLTYLVHQADYVASRPEYVDLRFIHVNEEIKDAVSQQTIPPYEPFPDSMLRGLIIGVMKDSLPIEDFIHLVKEGFQEDILRRVVTLRTPYINRKRVYNLENIMKTIHDATRRILSSAPQQSKEMPST